MIDMKKYLVIMTLLLSHSIFAAVIYTTEVSKPLSLQAGYKEITEVSIERIPAQSDPEFRMGMPFDIEDESTWYKDIDVTRLFSSGYGRIIANWKFISNAMFSVMIEAEPLSDSNKKAELLYSLGFEFILSYWDSNGNRLSQEALFIYDGSSKGTYLLIPRVKEYPDWGTQNEGEYVSMTALVENAGTGFIGNASGYIKFCFTEDATNKIKNDPDSVPPGEYKSRVTIHIRTEE